MTVTRSGIGLGAALALIMAAPGTSLGQQSIGREFHGVWELNSADQTRSCLDNDYDIRIEVFADRIKMHEGSCKFDDITLVDSSDPAKGVQLVLACAEEGAVWTDHQRWYLQDVPENGTLSISGLSPGNAFEVTYKRCPDDVLRSPWAGAAP